MNIQVGDTVQLTASLLLKLKEMHPDLYGYILESQRTGGKVIDITDEFISVDLTDADSKHPTLIDVDLENAHLALQLVQRVDGGPVMPATRREGACPGAVPGGTATTTHDHPAGYRFLGGTVVKMPPGFLDGILHPVQAPEDSTPAKIQMSQWVMTQFIGLKQYAIVQDLRRGDDDSAGSPDPTGESWKKKNFRPVLIELSSSEEALYNTALRQLQAWIMPEAPTSSVIHPEMQQLDASSTQPAPEPVDTKNDHSVE